MCFAITEQQNSTDRAPPGRRDSNVMNAIQQVQLQLNSLETESQRHSAKIQDILRATTRLESQRQEFIGILDRSESHISQRLEDVKGDVRKVLVLPEMILALDYYF
ncbi:hypothetical protein HNY73_014830 [Argiope bruennichi]|uniref:Uncharacterized protein n=1 Tax=Argiope bruennichi TaxID=94029 RepID=A0A8T0ES19_ARGBR|nr:hypothetical protein HNY73_014830 [Argiope bruennichi]